MNTAATATVAVEKPVLWKPPETHRLLPQSPDAEKGVICSFLLAPVEVGAFCKKHRLTPAQFHSPAYAELFGVLMTLWKQGKQIDFIILTELLRDEGRLEQVGGAAFVTELFTFLPTAANLAYYVEIVQEKHTLREIIATCTRYEERSYAGQDVGPLLLGELDAAIAEIAAGRGDRSLDELLAERRFDLAHPPAEPTAVFKLGEFVIATPENILMVAAKVKAGKTALIGAIIACTMEPTGDCLGFSSANPLGHAVIHFDTEQSKFHHHTVISRALLRAGRQTPPPWLFSYYVKGFAVEQLLAALRSELERRHNECGGIFAVILDGIGDYCLDVNDPAQAFALVAELEKLGVKYQTVFVLVLHENPGTEIGKTRGHLGSHLERKAETNLRMEKDGQGVTVVYSDRARTAHIPKEDGVRFAWSDEAKMHVSIETKAESKAETKRAKLRDLAVEVFRAVPDAVGLTWEQLHSRIEELDGIGRSGARKRFDALRDSKCIRKKGDKYLLA